MIRPAAILKFAHGFVLTAFLFATVGVGVFHPFFQPHHASHEDCAHKSASQETPSCQAEASFNAKAKCLICEFLSYAQTRYIAPCTTAEMGGCVFECHQQTEILLPQDFSDSPFRIRAPPFSTCS